MDTYLVGEINKLQKWNNGKNKFSKEIMRRAIVGHGNPEVTFLGLLKKCKTQEYQNEAQEQKFTILTEEQAKYLGCNPDNVSSEIKNAVNNANVGASNTFEEILIAFENNIEI